MVEGVKKANSKKDLAKRLNKQGEIIFVKEKSNSFNLGNFKLEIKNPFSKIKTKDIVEFCRQFSTLIYAGNNILDSLKVLRNEIKNPKLQKAIHDVSLDVQSGEDLSTALKNTKVFPKVFVNMISAGEKSGKLDEILINASEYLEKQQNFKENLKSSLTYPVFVLGFSVVIMFVLVNVIIPTFVEQLEGMGAEMPTPTLILIQVSEFFQTFWMPILLGIVLAFFGIYRYYKTSKGKERIDRLLLKTPILGKVIIKSNVVKISRTLSILDNAGVGILESLKIISNIVENKIIKQTLLDAQSKIEKRGVSLSKCLYDNKFFPRTFLLVTKVGEESGTIGRVMERMANDFEEEVDSLLQTMISLLKPTTIIIMGFVVGGLIVSIFMPMFSVMTQF